MRASLEEKLNRLPMELQQEVEDFTSFLIASKVQRKQKKLRLSWAGGLQKFRNQFTSLELQKKSLEWWNK